MTPLRSEEIFARRQGLGRQVGGPVPQGLIRPAKFADVPALYDLLQEGYARSRYAGRGAIDPRTAKGLLVNAIQRDGLTAAGGTWARVVEVEGRAVALLFALLQRVYLIGDRLQAIDLFWYAGPNCPVAPRVELARAMIEWAGANPDVIEIQSSATDIIEDYRRIGPIYRRLGFVQSGAIWRRDTGNAGNSKEIAA